MIKNHCTHGQNSQKIKRKGKKKSKLGLGANFQFVGNTVDGEEDQQDKEAKGTEYATVPGGAGAGAKVTVPDQER